MTRSMEYLFLTFFKRSVHACMQPRKKEGGGEGEGEGEGETMANRSIATFYLVSLLFLSALCDADAAFRPKFIPAKGPPVNPFCPWDTVKLGACVDLLGGTGSLVAPGHKCCAVIGGLANAEAAACLCTVVKESILGIVTAEWSVAVSTMVSSCRKNIPDGFRCV